MRDTLLLERLSLIKFLWSLSTLQVYTKHSNYSRSLKIKCGPQCKKSRKNWSIAPIKLIHYLGWAPLVPMEKENTVELKKSFWSIRFLYFLNWIYQRKSCVKLDKSFLEDHFQKEFMSTPKNLIYLVEDPNTITHDVRQDYNKYYK